MTHNLEATVFVYRSHKDKTIKAEYIDKARLLEDSPDWEHIATLEPRMWIEYHYAEIETLTQPEQEPVAHSVVEPLRHDEYQRRVSVKWVNQPVAGPLYATPPQRTWVGLTDKEAHELWESTDSDDDWELMKRTEAKLKEKNA